MKRFSVFFIFIMLVLLTGCAADRTEDDDRIKIYYLNSSGTGLVYEYVDFECSETNEMITEMITLADRMPSDPTYKKAKPDTILIQDQSFAGGVLTLDFTPDYSMLSQTAELLMRAALVKDFCQIEGVESVCFSVSTRPLFDSRGTIVGNMTSNDFVDVLNRNRSETRKNTFSVYFACNEKNKIKETFFTSVEPIEKTPAEIIIGKLIQGPEDHENADSYGTHGNSYLPYESPENVTATINPDCKLLKIYTKNDICYIDFDKKFLENPEGISDNIMIFAVVNSITSVTGISKVKITVEGAEEKRITVFETDGFLTENIEIVMWE